MRLCRLAVALKQKKDSSARGYIRAIFFVYSIIYYYSCAVITLNHQNKWCLTLSSICSVFSQPASLTSLIILIIIISFGKISIWLTERMMNIREFAQKLAIQIKALLDRTYFMETFPSKFKTKYFFLIWSLFHWKLLLLRRCVPSSAIHSVFIRSTHKRFSIK